MTLPRVWSLLVLVLLSLATHAQAQARPRAIAFTASADHAALDITGAPRVASYQFDVTADTATGALVFSRNVGKPTPDANNDVTVTIPEFAAMANGRYVATIAAVGMGTVVRSAPVTFDVNVAPVPVCTENGRPAVRLLVGDWTRTAKPLNSGRVLTALTQSARPIVRLALSLNGVEQGVLTGTDLRPTAGMYFSVPETPGTYQVTVSARDAQGCEDGVSRPMTLVVTP